MRQSIAVLLTVLGSQAAAAQMCTGNLPFAIGHFHMAANVAVDKLAMRYTGEFRFGTHGIFAAAEAGLKTWDVTSLADESNAVGLSAGLQLPLRATKLSVCPMFSWTSLSGPQNYEVKDYAAGLTVGYLAVRNNVWDIVPVAALSFGNRDTRLEGSDPSFPLPPYWRRFCCGREGFSMMSFAVGLGFGRQVTLIPSIALPLGENGETTYAARAALRLGKGR